MLTFRRAWCLPPATALVVLASCGVSAPSAPAGSSASPLRTIPLPTPTLPSHPRTGAELTPALLDEEDMPPGFEQFTMRMEGPPVPPSSDDSRCSALLAAAQQIGWEAKVLRGFVDASSGLHVVEDLSSAGSVTEATRVLDNIEAAVRDCPDAAEHISGVPGVFTTHRSLAPRPSLGDQALATTLHFDSGPWAGLVVASVVVRVRDLIAGLAFTPSDNGTVGQELIDQVTRLAVTKVLLTYGLDQRPA